MKFLPIRIDDELTGSVAFEFADGLSLCELEGYDGVVLELTEASHIDVNGMAVLVRVFSQLHCRGKSLHVVGACDDLSHCLTQLGLARALHAPPSRAPVPEDRKLRAITGAHAVVR